MVNQQLEEWRLEPKTVKHWHRKYHEMTDYPSAIDSYFCLRGNWMVSLTGSLLMNSFICQKGYANVEACGMFGEAWLTWLLLRKTCNEATAIKRWFLSHVFVEVHDYLVDCLCFMNSPATPSPYTTLSVPS